MPNLLVLWEDFEGLVRFSEFWQGGSIYGVRPLYVQEIRKLRLIYQNSEFNVHYLILC